MIKICWSEYFVCMNNSSQYYTVCIFIVFVLQGIYFCLLVARLLGTATVPLKDLVKSSSHTMQADVSLLDSNNRMTQVQQTSSVHTALTLPPFHTLHCHTHLPLFPSQGHLHPHSIINSSCSRSHSKIQFFSFTGIVNLKKYNKCSWLYNVAALFQK